MKVPRRDCEKELHLKLTSMFTWDAWLAMTCVTEFSKENKEKW